MPVGEFLFVELLMLACRTDGVVDERLGWLLEFVFDDAIKQIVALQGLKCQIELSFVVFINK